MRKRYAASFFLGADGDSPSLAEVSDLCIHWILKGGRTKLPDGTVLAAGMEMNRADLGRGSWLETIRCNADGTDHWAMRFGHPDETDPQIEWHTEVSVSRSPDGRTGFSCLNLVGSVGGIVAPTRRETTRPRIVRDVLRKWGGYRGAQLLAEPLPIENSCVDNLVDLLRFKDRELPVVFVSTENATDEPVIDAKKLADWLAGVAHVVVATDRYVSIWGLRDRLPQGMNCWDGSVRVYWPRLKLTDEPFHHRLWRADIVRRIESDRRNGFKEYLLGRLSEVAVFAESMVAPTWAELEAIRRRRLIAEARASGNHDDLLQLADQELSEQAKEIADLKLQVQQLAADLKVSEAKADSWRIAYQEVSKTGTMTPGPDQVDMVPIVSIGDALDRAKREFGDQLVLALNGRSDGARSQYQHPQAVYTALEFLASTYFNARTGKSPCEDFDHKIREQVDGWTYEPHQSKNTMRKYANWYSTSWDGRTHWLPEHIGTGSGKNPQHTIRIAFTWDDTSQKVIVGFLGQHQQTDAT